MAYSNEQRRRAYERLKSKCHYWKNRAKELERQREKWGRLYSVDAKRKNELLEKLAKLDIDIEALQKKREAIAEKLDEVS